MARWHLTSSPDLHGRASRVGDAADLRATGDLSAPGHHLRVYGKRAIDDANMLRLGDDWICVAGTVLFDHRIGGATLADIHRLFVDEGVVRTRRNLIGHYAMAIRHGDTITAFTDEQGSISLYYAIDGPRYVLSNSLHMAAACVDEPSLEPIEVVAHALQKMSTGPTTFLADVRRLFGSQVITIDTASGRVAVEDVPNVMRSLEHEPTSIEEAVDGYVELVRDTFSHLDAVSTLAVNTTGGIDTRTVLAATLERGFSPLLMYGVGNSKLTNTKTPDMQTAKALGDLTGLDFYTMDWSGNQPHSPERMTELFRRYGFLFSLFAGSDALLEEMEGGIRPYPQLQLGGYTPAFTNKKPWEVERDAYFVSDVVESFLESRYEHLVEPGRSVYPTHIEQRVRDALRHAPVAFLDEGASREVFTYCRLFVHLRRVSRTANFFNEFSFYLSPFMVKGLCDPLLTIPLRYRDRDEFQVRLIDALQPELLDVPCYSNMLRHEFDRATFTMHRVEPEVAKLPKRIRARIGRLLPRGLKAGLKRTLAHTPLRRVLLLSADDVKDLSINDRVREQVSDAVLADGALDGIVDATTVARIDLRSLHDMHVYLFGARQLNAAVTRSPRATQAPLK